MIIAIVSKYLKEQNQLDNNALVATIMSNLGLTKFAKENDIEVIQTKVGDRYVLESMLKHEYIIGGEQSGHVIFLKYNPTGDGILTACMLIKIMLEENKSANELSKVITMFPQVIVNAKVSNEKKFDYEKDEVIIEEIERLKKEFSDNGRVLVRTSRNRTTGKSNDRRRRYRIYRKRSKKSCKYYRKKVKIMTEENKGGKKSWCFLIYQTQYWQFVH